MTDYLQEDEQPLIPEDTVLGRALRHFPSNRTRRLIISAIVGVTSGLLLEFTLVRAPVWWGVPLTVILMGGVALFLFWRLAHIWNREIVVYERGFSFRRGSQTAHIPFAEVASIQQRAERLAYYGGLIRRTVYRIRMETNEDEIILIDQTYHNIAELGDILETRIRETLFPLVQYRINNGESISFGDGLHLDSAGITYHGGNLAWSDFSGHRIAERQLHLLTHDESTWATVPLVDLHTPTLLLDLLRTYKRT